MDWLEIGLILFAAVVAAGLAFMVVIALVIRAALRRVKGQAVRTLTGGLGAGMRAGLGAGMSGPAGGALARIGEKELARGFDSFRKTVSTELLASSPERLDGAVTKLAQKHKGELTAATVVAELGVREQAARDSLERLCRKETCVLTDEGKNTVRYVFPAFRERRPVKLCDYCESIFEPEEASSACLACGAPLRDGVTL